ncbi:tRNA lysidine(34) synthetase TilS [Sphingomonas sp. LY160]|uniref:tRNA lysidine(34) synthetase TilS n=1 Tax=Sphingomonas sp. LY160 TaxID=3095342 RepID=UPI002ADEDDD5|nr:tRNA lysidine(34) synthetase TilS [Sphingomonas sp. LY160]MEA1072078.1 tRNA lysidine(34) synthetase TilS [Sphingomonas sp. LY160]
MTVDPALVARFRKDLDALIAPGVRVGVAVSGGPDSLALLLLAAAVWPGLVEAATVDHSLREGSADEAATVAALCVRLGIPHQTLVADWASPPTAAIQAEARAMRYRLLGQWAASRGLPGVATAHHADDQAETLLMRLARGSGIAGLSGSRPTRPLWKGVTLIRPLLGWRKADFVALVDAAGLDAIDDPSNRDPRHDRSRIRQFLREADWLDPARLAASAAALRDSDDAIEWALAPLLATRLERAGDRLTIDPADLPREFRRRLLLAAFDSLEAPTPRGPDLMRAIAALEAGATVTLSGLKLAGGERWTITQAPPPR